MILGFSLYVGLETLERTTRKYVNWTGEGMLWLLAEAPDNRELPVHWRFDSYLAANVARGIWQSVSNIELAAKIRYLTEKALIPNRICLSGGSSRIQA